MLRAIRTVGPSTAAVRKEYDELVATWGITRSSPSCWASVMASSGCPRAGVSRCPRRDRLAVAGAAATAEVAFTFQDPEIVESSGLVAAGDRVFTTNDSGDTGRVFTVDTAPARPSGSPTGPTDPSTSRRSRRPVTGGGLGGRHRRQRRRAGRDHGAPGAGRPRRPGGRRGRARARLPRRGQDAETLLVHPVTGRLFVVTQGVFGGDDLRRSAGARPVAPNRLGRSARGSRSPPTARSSPMAAHVVRGYTSAAVYTYPGLERIGTFELPTQEQGEGIAVGADGDSTSAARGSARRAAGAMPPRSAGRATLARPPPRPPTADAEPDGGPTAVRPPRRGHGRAPAVGRRSGPWLVVVVLRRLAALLRRG